MRTVPLFVCLFISIAALAQDSVEVAKWERLVKFPLCTTDYFYYPSSDFNAPSGRQHIRMYEMRISLQAAFPLKEKKTYLLNGIEYTLLRANSGGATQSQTVEQNYQSVKYTLGLIQVLPKRWQLVVNWSPCIASDFKQRISSDDFINQFSAMAIKRGSPSVEYAVGLAYTSQFGYPLVLPVAMLNRRKNNWLTQIVLPSYLSQYYVFSEGTRVGVKLAAYGNLYNTSFTGFSSSYDLNRASYSRILLGPELQKRLLGDLYVNIGMGIAMGNALYVQDNDLKKELNLKVTDKFYFNIGLRILK